MQHDEAVHTAGREQNMVMFITHESLSVYNYYFKYFNTTCRKQNC
jgi:hypothetical protein